MRMRFTVVGSLLALAGAFTLAACSDSSNDLVEPQLRSDVPVSAMAPPRSPLVMDYIKTESDLETFNWFGSVSGDINGNLETQVVGVMYSGKIWHIQTIWTVTDAGAQNFVAELDGILDTSSGKLLLNGAIVSGHLAGARVHEDGVLTGFTAAGGTVFEGFLRIMPGKR